MVNKPTKEFLETKIDELQQDIVFARELYAFLGDHIENHKEEKKYLDHKIIEIESHLYVLRKELENIEGE